MRIRINGIDSELPADQVVVDVVAATTGLAQPRGVAVAVNGTVVRRAEWASTTLSDGDRVEVLIATQGG